MACASGNTGNIQSQAIGSPLNVTQTYGYDSTNRLTSISEGGSTRSFAYNNTSGYNNGNMYVSANSGFPLASFTPTSSGNFNSQNQLAIQNSSYDSAGNQTAIGGLAPQFDAEGRMTSTSLNGTTVTYVYDGDGQRVMKQVSGSTPTTTVYVYDAFGNAAAEYTTPAPASPCGTATCYVSVDHLGSTRLVTDSSGNVQKRYDYLPFGEELFAGIDGRTTAMKYQSAADGFSPKFTGQYRDADLVGSADAHGLDYFNARYYSPTQGRFVSPDPGNAGADISNPRTWNGYSYVGNNPLNVTDPNGLGFFDFLDGIIHNVLSGVTFGLWGAFTAAIEGTPPPSGTGTIGAAIFGPGTPGTGSFGNTNPGDFPNGESLGMPSGMSIPDPLSTQTLLGLWGWDCSTGICVPGPVSDWDWENATIQPGRPWYTQLGPCAKSHFGVTAALASGAGAAKAAEIPMSKLKYFGVSARLLGGTTGDSSLARYVAVKLGMENIMRLDVRILGTKSIAGMLGRGGGSWISLGLLGIDAYQIGNCAVNRDWSALPHQK